MEILKIPMLYIKRKRWKKMREERLVRMEICEIFNFCVKNLIVVL